MTAFATVMNTANAMERISGRIRPIIDAVEILAVSIYVVCVRVMIQTA